MYATFSVIQLRQIILPKKSNKNKQIVPKTKRKSAEK